MGELMGFHGHGDPQPVFVRENPHLSISVGFLWGLASNKLTVCYVKWSMYNGFTN